MNPHEEQRLRDLLDDAVSEVEPRDGLDAIMSRTKVSSMSTRPWLYGVAGAVVATAATIAAFAVLDDDTTQVSNPQPAASSTPASEESSESAEPTESAEPEPDTGRVTVPVYYAGDTGQGPRLFREFHQVGGGLNDAAEAVREALGATALDPDYRSLWPSGSDVQHVEVQGDTIVVDLKDAARLHDRPSGMSEREAQLALEQLIYTAQGVHQDRAPVRFLLDGQITDTVLGVPTAEPLVQGDEMATLAQVWIIDPQDGDTVKPGAEVSGIGAFFEANVVWELRRGGADGKVVESGFTTAEQCCTMAPYSFELPNVPAGQYVLVVKDEDASGGEGPPPFQDTKQITIR